MSQTVLIVENDPEVMEQITLYVKDCDFRVQCATDVETAMSKLRNHRLPIAIIDWELPNGEAIEIIQQIRENHRLRRTHILVLSSQNDPAIVEASMNIGANDFFSKPIGPAELRSRLVWASSRSQAMI